MIQLRVIRAVVVTWVLSQGIQAALGQGAPGAFTDSKEPPTTPAARRAQELLDLVNANDPQRISKYIAENFAPGIRDEFPMEEHLGMFAQMHNSSGGFDLYGFRSYDPPRPETAAVAVMRNRLTEAWNAIVVEVETEPPHRVTSVQFAPARPPKDAPPAGPIKADQLASELKAFVEKLVKAKAFSGTVLVAKEGKVLFSGAYGLASKDYDVPNRLDTKFNLGSMNKMFTAVAVAQLTEQGKLAYDDPLSKYLSTDWLPREVSDKITVEHLLTHTSGLGSYFSEKFMGSSRALYRKVDDYKPLVAEEKPQFEPGTQWAYSNTGMLLLGAVIEKASGEDYFDYVRKNIYEPAGMKNSDCYELDHVNPNLAVGYSKETGPNGQTVWTNNIFKHVLRGGPAGGGYSTVEDLLRFDQAMRANKLVKAETAERIWSPKPNSPEYGYGFGLQGEPGNRIVGHSGGFPGINSVLEMHLDTGYTIAVMSNYDRGAMPVANKINELLKRIE